MWSELIFLYYLFDITYSSQLFLVALMELSPSYNIIFE